MAHMYGADPSDPLKPNGLDLYHLRITTTDSLSVRAEKLKRTQSAHSFWFEVPNL